MLYLFVHHRLVRNGSIVMDSFVGINEINFKVNPLIYRDPSSIYVEAEVEVDYYYYYAVIPLFCKGDGASSSLF